MKFFLASILFLFSICLQAQVDKVIPPRPATQKLVNDLTGNTLTEAQKQALENKLVAYDDSTSNQIAVVIINSLKGYDIGDYALHLFRKWGIGNKKTNNGILVLVAKEDRKLRIEVGYGLEGVIPDITSKHIIDESITPSFKEENYYRGLDKGTDDIIKAAAGEYKAPANYGKRNSKRPGFASILGVIAFLVLMAAMGAGGRNSGGTMSGAGWIIGSLLSGSGRGGGGFGGGGGGGFGGFGGGSSGGGGASGSW